MQKYNVDVEVHQEAFNRVLEGIRKQGKPALGQTRAGAVFCMYRAPDGCKCGVGFLMDDLDYQPSFENKIAKALVSVTSLNKYDPEFLVCIQVAHDKSDKVDGKFLQEFEDRMKITAEQFGLKYAA